MGIEQIITQEEHGHLNKVIVEGFRHRFSGVKSIMERVIAYAISHNIETFSEAALEIYNESLPKELEKPPENWLYLSEGQGNLLFIEKFLIIRELIDEPNLEKHLKPESHNMHTYARDHGFDPEILFEVIKESGWYSLPNHAMRQIVDTVRRRFDELDVKRRSEEFYGLQIYRMLEVHIEQPNFLPVLQRYLLKTSQITPEEVRGFKPFDELAIFGINKGHYIKRDEVVRRVHEYNKQNPSNNPVFDFYQSLMRGEQRLGRYEWDGKRMLRDFLISRGDVVSPR